MVRIILYTILLLFSSGCYYDFKTGCFYAPQHAHCNYKEKSHFDSYFKEGVDDHQKLLDVKDCLGIDGDGIPTPGGSIFATLRDKYPHSHQGDMAIKKFDECMMLKKGYLYDSRLK